jgi:hemoglobin
MKTSHNGLGINEEDWDTFVKLANQTFDKFKVPERERKEVLAALGARRKI